MRFLHGFWFNAIASVFFAFYALGFFFGTVEPDPFVAGCMATSLFFNCLADSIKAKMVEGYRP